MNFYRIKLTNEISKEVYFNEVKPFTSIEKARDYADLHRESLFDPCLVELVPQDDLFKVVTWPLSQELMEIEGFEENSCLINDEPLLDQYGSSAYFVRYSWFIGLKTVPLEDSDPIDIPDVQLNCKIGELTAERRDG